VAATSDKGFKVEALGDVEILVTRMFNAPPRLVFQAHSSCEYLKKWFHAPASTLEVCEVDFRVGGAFRFGWANPGGQGFELTGEYKEIVPHSRIVQVERFSADPTTEALGTLTLEEQDGRTRLTRVIKYPSQQMRDWLLKSGMSKGLRQVYDHLDEYVALQQRS